MCYPKPGPRCSSHAAAELKKREAKLLASLGTPDALQAYEEKAEAQRQFELTPAGHKELLNRIESETDAAKKAELEAHLKNAKEARAEAIAAAKATDVGDVTHAAKERAKPKLPTSVVPASTVHYQPVTSFVNPYLYLGYSTDSKDRESHQASLAALLDHHALDYDYTSGQDWNCSCSEDDYHRCNVIEPVGFTTPLTAEKFARAVFGVKYGDPVPEALKKPFEDFDLEGHLELVSSPGYYGDEALGLEMSRELKHKVEEVSRSMPDANDSQGSYEYARQEGVVTTGLTPVEAVKRTVAKKLPAAVKKIVSDSKQSQHQQVALSQIDSSSFNLASVDAYDYRGQKNAPGVSGGLLVKTGPKQYHLVGGADRFKAVQALGRSRWSFQVLGDWPVK